MRLLSNVPLMWRGWRWFHRRGIIVGNCNGRRFGMGLGIGLVWLVRRRGRGGRAGVIHKVVAGAGLV